MSDAVGRLNEALQGRYRVERELGEGGMATVYLAEDLRHERQVALKVLRPELAAVIGAERFVAEIKTTAALQHPHILPLFDSGEADGFLYYVMPYVEGDSLRDRLDRERQLNVAEALDITRDVADALDYAHRQGVIHRDIKPENILLHEGRPVVADFGIAVAIRAAGGGRMTETGLSLGTPHYMSPEQAAADRDLTARSDVYSLACVLYELLAGDPPHTGPTAQAILVRILTETPRPVSHGRPAVPPHVAAALAKALEKLPADRFQTVAEFRDALERTDFTYRPVPRTPTDVGSARLGPTAMGPEGEHGGPRGRLTRLVPWGIAAAAVALALFMWSRSTAEGIDGVVRLDLALGQITPGSRQDQVAISADGSLLALAGRREGEEAIFVRGIDEGDWRRIAGTDGGQYPSFSPDGEWLVFQAEDDSRLIRVSTTGGGTFTLVDNEGTEVFDPHWGGDGTIVFTNQEGTHRVSEAGGQVTTLSELFGSNPHLLPDGSGVLIGTDLNEIHYHDLATDSSWLLIPDARHPWYLETGHVLFVPSGGGLFVAPFDPDDPTEIGTPRRVLDRVAFNDVRRGYAVARNGTLVHLEGRGAGSGGDDHRFVVFDRSGSRDTLGIRSTSIGQPRFSPDGRYLTYVRSEGPQSQIHTFDLLTGAPRQITFEGDNNSPVWSPDGTHIAFGSRREGTDALDLFVKPADNSSPERLLLTAPAIQVPDAWPSDTLLGVFQDADENNDLLLVHLPGSDSSDSVRVEPYLRAEWDERRLDISPDMTLAALETNEAGPEVDVWIRSFPDPVGQWRVSTGGGQSPQWSPDGGTLYYWSGAAIDTLIAVTVERNPSVRITGREAILAINIQGVGNWDLHPDGERFVIRVAAGGAATEPSDEALEDTGGRYLVVLNWFDELREMLEGS